MTAVAGDGVLEVLRRYGDHPSGFLAYNDAVEHWTDNALPGAVPYRRKGRHLFILGAPMAPPESRAALLAAFGGWAARRRLRLAAVQVRRDDLPLFDPGRFAINRLGLSYSIDLARFTTGGSALAKIRQNVRRARRDGVTVSEADSMDAAVLDEIDRAWLRHKGRHVKPLDFMVGERGGRGEQHRRLFVARCADRVVGYITYSPAFGARPGWLYDLTRRAPDAPVGTVELINLTALETFRDEQAGWLHLGLTPFLSTGGDETAGAEPAGSPVLSALIRAVERHGAALYPARNAHAFKVKWAPHVVEPEYLAFQRPLTPAAALRLLRLVNAI
jgi:lysylphosphatidylglycerol synthetase-like protein (DUF2156 family)